MPGPGRGNIMLKIENASKTFNPGTINEKVALDHISLILEDGDFATIVGSRRQRSGKIHTVQCHRRKLYHRRRIH